MESQNGWSVISAAHTATHPLIGRVRAGDVWCVMHWLATRYDLEVERIDTKQSGGYNRRKIAGSAKWSNHASGTAIDLNWRKHPVGGTTTGFTDHQVTHIKAIMRTAGGVLRWGGPAFRDPMHFEIAPGVTPAQVRRLRAILLQQMLHGLGYYNAAIDGVRGPKTKAAARAYRRKAGLIPLAVDDRAMWTRLTATYYKKAK